MAAPAAPNAVMVSEATLATPCTPIPPSAVADTVPDAMTETAPAPMEMARIPATPPVTAAAAIVSAPPLPAACTPVPPAAVADTAPEAMTETAPVPLDTARIPMTPPVTAAAVIASAPAPRCEASIPVFPATAATSTATPLAAVPPMTWTPAVPVPVTGPVALTDTDPDPLPTALIPTAPPVTVAAVTASAPPAGAAVFA